MERRDRCQKAIHDAWEKAADVKDRIRRLKKVVDGYPEHMTPLSNLAATYLEAGNATRAVETYRRMIASKNTYKHVWNNELGKAYLFTGDYGNAVLRMEEFEKSGHDYSNGLLIALAHLKGSDRSRFEQRFCMWIAEDLSRAFDRYRHDKYVNALFDKADVRYIGEVWERYSKKYSGMKPYELYCEIYKQRYRSPGTSPEDLCDEGFRAPGKLTRSGFERLSSEYLNLDRKAMFGDLTGADRAGWLELKELLFAHIIFR